MVDGNSGCGRGVAREKYSQGAAALFNIMGTEKLTSHLHRMALGHLFVQHLLSRLLVVLLLNVGSSPSYARLSGCEVGKCRSQG